LERERVRERERERERERDKKKDGGEELSRARECWRKRGRRLRK